MATAIHHAISSAKKFGGIYEDYMPIHEWFDSTKGHVPDFRHRALRHHSEGIVLMEQVFGPAITNSDGRLIPTKWVGEQHVLEDFGYIPTAADWMRCIKAEPWMCRGARRLSDELEGEPVHG